MLHVQGMMVVGVADMFLGDNCQNADHIRPSTLLAVQRCNGWTSLRLCVATGLTLQVISTHLFSLYSRQAILISFILINYYVNMRTKQHFLE